MASFSIQEKNCYCSKLILAAQLFILPPKLTAAWKAKIKNRKRVLFNLVQTIGNNFLHSI
jgi:hypothetical protein